MTASSSDITEDNLSERGFSEMNRVLTKDRTRLIARRLSSVMSVSLITPPVVQFKVSDALRQLFHQLVFPYLSSTPKSSLTLKSFIVLLKNRMFCFKLSSVVFKPDLLAHMH